MCKLIPFRCTPLSNEKKKISKSLLNIWNLYDLKIRYDVQFFSFFSFQGCYKNLYSKKT
jgi:hypothetical protein